jgi:hypothetical protein
MARANLPAVLPFYNAAQRFVDVALRADDSLFTPSRPVWSLANLDDLYRRFIEQPDTGGDSFEVKFQHQLQGAPPAIYQLGFLLEFVRHWKRIQAYVAEHWNERLDPDDPDRVIRFDDLITKAVTRISQLRNTAAHTNPLPRREYTELQTLIFQGGKLGYSALNALLLGWHEVN